MERRGGKEKGGEGMEESFPIVPVLRNDHCLHSKFVSEMCRSVLQDRRHCFWSCSGYCVCVVCTSVRVVDDG